MNGLFIHRESKWKHVPGIKRLNLDPTNNLIQVTFDLGDPESNYANMDIHRPCDGGVIRKYKLIGGAGELEFRKFFWASVQGVSIADSKDEATITLNVLPDGKKARREAFALFVKNPWSAMEGLKRTAQSDPIMARKI